MRTNLFSRTEKEFKDSILYEDSSLFRIVDSSGIEMRLRKSELNLTAMESMNIPVEPLAEPDLPTEQEAQPVVKRPAPCLYKSGCEKYKARSICAS